MKKPPIKSIPTSKFSRGMKIAKLSTSVGASMLGGKIAGLFQDKIQKELSGISLQIAQARKIANTLSQMKGAAMKLGQILSIHGEHLFPKEVVDILSQLQSQSVEMAFSEIEKVLKKELGERYGSVLSDVSSEPIASASIGQVHTANVAAADEEKSLVAVKIQYPGVDKSIDSDIDALASVLSLVARFPAQDKGGLSAVTDEIKEILHLETDYDVEGLNMERARKHFEGDDAVVVPRFFKNASSKRVLTAEFMKGISVQEFRESTASKEARTFLGRKYLEVFYREMFELGAVQTDPNFANYKIQWSFGVQEPKLVLLDFGAVKIYDEKFRKQYKRLVRVCLDQDYDGVFACAREIGFLREDDSKELIDTHFELATMLVEPFLKNEPYAWAESDLPERLRKFLPKFFFAFKLRPPPRDFIFLNRKVMGVYFFCSAIKSEFNPRSLIERFAK